mmetsp:Transcript_31525/g.46778  ORF Transcript_31525/g.46778 Transcript_31525/m.46778 type:complete len:92 (+) Transcript_31525:1155-1430(+)
MATFMILVIQKEGTGLMLQCGAQSISSAAAVRLQYPASKRPLCRTEEYRSEMGFSPNPCSTRRKGSRTQTNKLNTRDNHDVDSNFLVQLDG